MAYEILTESYGRRLPKITAEADSTDDLATLGTNYAEGSTCVIGDKTYSLDKVQGWVEPGSSGGGGVFWVNFTWDRETDEPIADKTAEEVYTAVESGLLVMGKEGQSGEWTIYRLSGAFHNALTEAFTVVFTTQSYSDTVTDTSTAYASQFSLSDNGVTYTSWSWDVEDAT